MSSLDHNRLGCHSSIDRKRLWVEHHMCPCMVSLLQDCMAGVLEWHRVSGRYEPTEVRRNCASVRAARVHTGIDLWALRVHTSGRYVVDKPAQPRERDAISVQASAGAPELAAIPQGLPGAAALAARLPASPAVTTPESAAATTVFPGDFQASTALGGLGTSAARLFRIPSNETP
jgi:hypothetical protein